jgi:hypothetical protein
MVFSLLLSGVWQIERPRMVRVHTGHHQLCPHRIALCTKYVEQSDTTCLCWKSCTLRVHA